jgi:hypothetical protein
VYEKTIHEFIRLTAILHRPSVYEAFIHECGWPGRLQHPDRPNQTHGDDHAYGSNTTPTRRSALGLSAAAIIAGLTKPAIASAMSPNPDAELIALCDLFTQNEAKQNGLFVTIRNDDERDVALEPLSAEWRSLLDQIEQFDGPATMAGARAMARAALATCPVNLDGSLQMGGDPEGWFHICIAKFLVGSAAT